MKMIVLLILFVCLLAIELQASLLSSEIQVLVDLYQATQGDNWFWLPEVNGIPWNISQVLTNEVDPCLDNWQGIDCSCVPINSNDHPNSYNYYYYYGSQYNNAIECTITGLSLPSYNLQGTIPMSLNNLFNLTFIHLPSNSLQGNILNVLIPHCPKLMIIGLANNIFTGTIPSEIVQLTQLNRLVLGDNLFTGTIPSEISSLTLYGFDIRNNLLSGSIPHFFHESCSMRYFDLSNNQLIGLFDEVISCPKIWYFNIARNHFTGNIPEFNQTFDLNVVNFNENQFTGSISLDDFTMYTQLHSLSCSTTLLHGTIPESITNLQQLMDLDLGNSFFEGSIPDEFGQLTQLGYLYLQNTLISHQIPPSIGNLLKLRVLNISQAHITGTIPSTFSNLTQLQILYASENKLKGTIPDVFYQMNELEYLVLHSNQLTGEIPTSIMQLPSLFMLNIKSNLFTSISTSQPIALPHVFTFDISSNKLSKPFPIDFFQSTNQLTYFVAGSNCLPQFDLDSICQAIQLKIFSIDGMNKACSSSSNHIDTYKLPKCIFNITNLEIFHASGIGLIGTIPEISSFSSLIELSLSHNLLTGRLPQSIYHRQWNKLDVSFNKLTGILENQLIVTNETSISYQVNRFSGAIPLEYQGFKHIQLLNGNSFTCDLISHDTLPPNDPDTPIYSCGTNYLNILLYWWYGFWIITICYQIIQKKVCISLQNLMSFFSFPSYPNDKNEFSLFLFLLQCIQCRFYWSYFIIACILLPIYLILNHYFSVSDYTYAFQVSSIYQSGLIPAIIFAIVWLCILFMVYYSSDTLTNQFKNHLPKKINSNISLTVIFHENYDLLLQFLGLSVLSFSFLSSYILILNIGFVYTQITYGPNIAIFCQVILAIIKLLTNQFLIPIVMKINFSPIQSIKLNVSRQQQMHWIRKTQMLFEVSLALISNIIAPCIATAVTSSNCFYYLIFPPPPVTTIYSLLQCQYFYIYIYQYYTQCIEYISQDYTTVYQPSFTYSYQCMSFMIFNYTSVYVYMYLLNSFIKPIVRQIFHTLFQYKNYFQVTPQPKVDEIQKIHFNKDAFLMEIIVSISILLTFGLMYPPLAFITTYNILELISNTIQDIETIISDSSNITSHSYKLIRKELLTIISDLHINLQYQVLPIASLFASYLLFDTFGDSYGWENGIFMVISFLLCMILFYLFMLGKIQLMFCNSYHKIQQENIQVLPTTIVTPTTNNHLKKRSVGISQLTAVLPQDIQEFANKDEDDEEEDDDGEKEETLYDLIATLIGVFFAF